MPTGRIPCFFKISKMEQKIYRSLTKLAEAHGVVRKTAYNWLQAGKLVSFYKITAEWEKKVVWYLTREELRENTRFL